MKKATDPEDLLRIHALFDIRVEALLAALRQFRKPGTDRLDTERMVVATQGAARSRSHNDVGETRIKHYETEDVLLVEVNRKGLFDTLPLGLFLHPDLEKMDPVSRTRAISNTIQQARKFFLPFEQAMYHARIETEMLEQDLTDQFPDWVSSMWGLDAYSDCLTTRQRFLLNYLIPLSSHITGQWELTGLCFEAVLQKPVNIYFSPPKELENTKAFSLNGVMELGSDTVMEGSFLEDFPSLVVGIKGITVTEIDSYLPGGHSHRILEDLLYSYFLPLDIPVDTRIEVTTDAFGCILGQDVLGTNTQLKN